MEDKNELLYYQLRTLYHGGQLPTLHYSEAAHYYFINKTAYSGMIRHNAQGEFNVPYRRYRNLNTAQVSYAHSCLLHRDTLCQRHLRAVPA